MHSPRNTSPPTGGEPGAARRLWIGALSPLVLIVGLFLRQLAAVVAHRHDYPIDDDWRYYMEAFGLPDALSLEWLFLPAMDTLHVTGKLADWLFLRFVVHDLHHLSATAFALAVGTWLACGIAICLVVARRRPLLAFASLIVFALPLAANPYWVRAVPGQWLEPVIAYHQMLPVTGLFLLGLLCLRCSANRPHRRTNAIAAALTAAFCLTYSSGAATLFVFGALLTLFPAGNAPEGGDGERPSRSLGITVLVTATLCVAAHVVAPKLVFDMNPIVDTRGDNTMALPWTSRFWVFFFSLFDRSVLSTTSSSAPSSLGIAVALLVIAPAIGLTLLARKGRLDERTRGFAMVLVAITGAVVAYALLVTYGRGAFGSRYFPGLPADDLRASLYAHHRFFYWWISALLPLTVLGWGLFLRTLAPPRVAAASCIALATFLLLPKPQDPETESAYWHHWRFAELYRSDAERVAWILEGRFGRLRESPEAVSQLPAALLERRPLFQRALALGASFMDDPALRTYVGAGSR